MKRKDAVRIERALRGMGVRKPFVSSHSHTAEYKYFFAESYPLEVRAVDGFCRENGPFTMLELRDCSLPRIGLDSLVAMDRVWMGGDVTGRIAALILAAHPEAFARAQAQDKATCAESAARRLEMAA